MKIAIIAPSPVPFEVGGAEKLWWGMQAYINKHTVHQCELIKIPTRELSFWDLIESYYFFYRQDYSYFEMVITCKYPAWMVQHQNHICYMLHCIRGLYDTYLFHELPVTVKTLHPRIKKILDTIDDGNISLDEIFPLLFELRDDPSVPQVLFIFPGPFIRKIIHFLDHKAMLRIKRFSTISQTVANRKDYFPGNTDVQVIYPPSNLEYFKAGAYEYFFTVSRLDGPKRIKMIVEAYLQAKTDIPLKIAGTGPLEKELKEMTMNDKRIEFLGFVSDQDLIEYYADALAVFYVPYDEDYGLITIEAMMSEKPVITFTDSGGVTEFVEHGKNGWICKPQVEELKKTIEDVSRYKRSEIAAIGKTAKKKVEFITWEHTIKTLLENRAGTSQVKKKKRKVVVISTYPIYPPRGGGQNRIYYLYKEVAKTCTVEIISLTNEHEKSFHKEIAPGLWETRIAKSKIHAEKEWSIQKEVDIPVTDIAFMYHYRETPAFVERVRQVCRDTEYVVCACPYSYPLVHEVVPHKIIHESQNVEFLLKKQMLPQNDFSIRLLDKIFHVEQECCMKSAFTTVCTMEDARTMHELYNLKMDTVVEVPNGVDLDSVTLTDPDKKLENKRKINIIDATLALFMGSWHQPNIEAVEKIFKIAQQLPQIQFLIIGSVCLYFKDKPAPRNVGFMGVVDDGTKDYIFSIADIALNPMLSGSGTNLKMLDYMAAGIPVISTRVGARGLNLNDDYVEICDIDQFVARIRQVTGSERMQYKEKIYRARKYVEETFDWKIIGRCYIENCL